MLDRLKRLYDKLPLDLRCSLIKTRHRITDDLRRLWPLLAVVLIALGIFGSGAQLVVQIYSLSMSALVIILAHLVRKALFPYLDMKELAFNACRSGLGAALIFCSIIALIITLMVTSARAEISPNARQYLPILQSTTDRHWPGAPTPHIMAGQVEQESNWKTGATLKTSRELGRGLTQLTIAYRADGSERFNAYRDAVRIKQLSGWDWQNDPYNATYQLTYLVLRNHATFNGMRRWMRSDADAWRATLVGYNAGEGRVSQRRAMALTRSLPTDRWLGGLDQAHGPKEEAILYGRPLWVAVNEYPEVIFKRATKYQGAL